MSDNNNPLSGLRVLEFARVLAGPWAGQIFADLGADVIKVESPQGDDTRRWGPPFIDNPSGTQDAAYFHSSNRGKKSTVLDFSCSSGREKARQLAANADVIIENFKVGSLKKFGLDYDSVSAINSKLIYCSITGFGQFGPYANRPGYDFLVQGMSGIMDLTGEADGPPQKIGIAFADIFAGLYAVIGIQAALAQRDRTGKGQHIDISLLDCMVGVLANQGMNYLTTGNTPTRLGNRHPNISPYDVFPTLEGSIIIAIGNENQFARFCKTIGQPDLPLNERFNSNEKRVENRDALMATLSEITTQWHLTELNQLLIDNAVPVAPINTVEDALNDKHVAARKLVIECTRTGGAKSVPGIRTPIIFSDANLNLGQPSPELDEGVDGWS